MDIAKMTSLTRDTYTKEILNRKRESQENTPPTKKKDSTIRDNYRYKSLVVALCLTYSRI